MSSYRIMSSCVDAIILFCICNTKRKFLSSDLKCACKKSYTQAHKFQYLLPNCKT